MITLGNNSSIEVSLGDYTLTSFQDFTGLTIIESSGVVIPSFELQLRTTKVSVISALRSNNCKVTVSFGPDTDHLQTYDVLVMNYNFTSNGDDSFTLGITGILDLKDFTNPTKIQFIEETSDKVLASISSITPMVDYTGADKQIWIQHNNTDKNFVERVLEHAFIAEDDCVISALTIAKELIVKSAKKTFSGGPLVVFDNSASTSYNKFKFESDSALWSGFLSEGRKLPIIHIKERKVEMMDTPSQSLVDSKAVSDYTTNVNFPFIVDNGNCHDNYYKAWLGNLAYQSNLNRHVLYLFLDQSYLDNDKLKLLDLVQITSSDNSHFEEGDPTLGKYIVTEKITHIGPDKYSQRLRLARDFTLD